MVRGHSLGKVQVFLMKYKLRTILKTILFKIVYIIHNPNWRKLYLAAASIIIFITKLEYFDGMAILIIIRKRYDQLILVHKKTLNVQIAVGFQFEEKNTVKKTLP